MILEFVEYLMTQCSPTARSMQFLLFAIQVRARYRRQRRAWQPHIDRTRGVILEAARRCRGRRKVVVLGAGLLHDIPLVELSREFDKVVLVDIVHPWLSRLAVRRFPNVEQLSADVTEVMDELLGMVRAPRSGGLPVGLPGSSPPAGLLRLPVSRPMRFVDDPELDLTLSVNLLSQLSQAPRRLLEGQRRAEACAPPDEADEAAIDAFLKHLVEAHLDYLSRLPGHTALITDTAVYDASSRDARILAEMDPLFGAKLPPAEASWRWDLAPSPEIARGVDVYTTVAAFPDWKKAARPT